MNESDYDIGFRAAWLRMFTECVKMLDHDGNTESWRVEREEAVVALRMLCDDLGLNNSWSSDLHLADIVEKYVRRSLEGQLK